LVCKRLTIGEIESHKEKISCRSTKNHSRIIGNPLLSGSSSLKSKTFRILKQVMYS